MHADGVGLDGHLFTGNGRDLALFYHAHGAGNGLVRVVNHRAGLGAGHQAAVGLVGTVGKYLTGHPQPGGPACAQQLAARKPQQDHVLVHRGNALGNAGGQGFVLGGHVVQGAVGLHVLQGHPVGGAEGQQRAHLVLHIGLGLGGGAHQIPAAKAHQVGVAGVRAHGHARRFGGGHGFVHHQRVARMVAAGHVDRGDVLHHLAVQPDGVCAEALAQIAVQVYFVHKKTSLPGRRAPPDVVSAPDECAAPARRC